MSADSGPNRCECCGELFTDSDAVRVLNYRTGTLAVHERCTTYVEGEPAARGQDLAGELGERHIRPAE